MRRPGTIPARKSSPIDCSAIIPKIIRVMLGGKITPRVPTEATIPVESCLLYPCLRISGTARLEKVAVVARVEPHMALKSVAPTTVVMARPPGTWPTSLWADP
jgi:hypothetical protein